MNNGKEKEKVLYCEFPFMGEPIEQLMSKKEALKRFNEKIEALKGFVFGDGWFVGVKTQAGKWLIKN